MTRSSMTILAGLLLAAACRKPSNPGDNGHTDPGHTVDDTGDTGDAPCTVLVQEISPDDGETDFYYRDAIEVLFTEPAQDIASFDLVDSDGVDYSLKAEFDETGMNAVILALDPLQAGLAYTFTASVCDDSAVVGFTTSVYGAPLLVDPSELVDLTFHFDLGGASYTKPAGIGFLIAQYLTDPFLIGVVAADADSITLMGAQGWVNDDSEVVQRSSLATYDFGAADFSDSPFFAAEADVVDIDYDGYSIPLHEFHLEGTFEPDGASIGGAMLHTLADTRHMGPLLKVDDDPDAVCTLAHDYLGLECEDCPDGYPYCMTLEGSFDPAPVVDGLVLQPISGS